MYSSYNKYSLCSARLDFIHSHHEQSSQLVSEVVLYAVAKRNIYLDLRTHSAEIGEPMCARHSVVNRWTFFADYTTSSCIVAAMFSGTFRISGRIASQRRNNCVRTTYPYHSHNNLNSCFVNDYRHIAGAYGLCNGVVRQQNSSECVYFESKR